MGKHYDGLQALLAQCTPRTQAQYHLISYEGALLSGTEIVTAPRGQDIDITGIKGKVSSVFETLESKQFLEPYGTVVGIEDDDSLVILDNGHEDFTLTSYVSHNQGGMFIFARMKYEPMPEGLMAFNVNAMVGFGYHENKLTDVVANDPRAAPMVYIDIVESATTYAHQYLHLTGNE